jgi:hypothetical protein
VEAPVLEVRAAGADNACRLRGTPAFTCWARALCLLALLAPALRGQEAGLRVVLRGCDLDGDGALEPCGMSLGKPFDIETWEVPVSVASGSIRLNLGVYLSSGLEPCASTPGACSGGENFVDDSGGSVVFGCNDRLDNDGNGVSDREDPDCIGIQAWSIALSLPPEYTAQIFTVSETAGDLLENGGYRASSGSFSHTERALPERNGGASGVVSTVILSYIEPVILPQVGDELVLRVEGRLDTGAVTGPGHRPRPYDVRLLGPDTPGLRGSGAFAIKTTPTVDGFSEPASLCHARVQLVGTDPSFLRGDATDSGGVDLGDILFTLNWLFLSGSRFRCTSAADANDDGEVDISDALYAVFVLFFPEGGPSEFPLPYPGCGTDPTPDPLGCLASACP